MRIIGIDPGTAIVGYGVLDYIGNQFKVVAYGAITTPATSPMSARLKTIYQELQAVIELYQPAHIAVEELFYNTNAKTVISVGQARGVILLAGAEANLEVAEYTPLQVKQAVVGYGRAEKKQVQEMIKILLKLEKVPKPDDVADALAIAICHAHSYKLGRL
ncbi:MAG: crossover junction endodeoxyribonuclease RuvC [Clostridia bacterium]